MTSQVGSQVGSQMGLPPGTPTYGTYGTDGESGYERGNLTGADARANSTPRSLATTPNCRYCGQPIYVAICFDGRWRSFDRDTYPAAPTCVWAWRKHQGMQEQDLVPGKRLHFCAEYDHARPWEVLP